jgi:hypothetical protein
MKFIALLLFVALATSSSYAQLVFEHAYPNPAAFGVVRVDSNEWRYVSFNGTDSIQIFDLTHSLERIIVFPNRGRSQLIVIAKNLFKLDGKYYCLLFGPPGANEFVVIYDEDGHTLFERDSAYFSSDTKIGTLGDQNLRAGLVLTNAGMKMVLFKRTEGKEFREVYSLPGKLPGSTLGLKSDLFQTSGDFSLQTSAFPNPSRGRTRINYELPIGVTQGEIVLCNEAGFEVRRYQVTNAFSDLLIDGSGFPNGIYFYKLITAKGESGGQSFSIFR